MNLKAKCNAGSALAVSAFVRRSRPDIKTWSIMGFLSAIVIVIGITTALLAPACGCKQIESTVIPMPVLTEEKVFDKSRPQLEVLDEF